LFFSKPSFSFAHITINKANIFITLLIFVFTILFAYLLIFDNYHDYERDLKREQIAYESDTLYNIDHEQNQQKLKSLLIKNTVAIATLSFIIFAIMFGLSKVFQALLQNDLKAYLEFFQKMAHTKAVLDEKKLFFHEFKMMVEYANKMASTIDEQKNTLHELNQNLEQRVAIKTKKLIDINENLLEEQKLSNNLIKAQKEFLRQSIHETNTPLAVILTNIELYNLKYEKNNHMSKIEVAAKNLFSIYDDLSYLVRKNHLRYPKSVVNLASFLISRIDFFSEVALMSNLELVSELDVKSSFIEFNETKLSRIIDNTITNAIKYTPAHEKIDIKLNTNDKYIYLSIGSNSKEIQDKKKIFEAFYREEQNIDGFGLGLGLVKSICEEDGVEITLDKDGGKNIFTYRFELV